MRSDELQAQTSYKQGNMPRFYSYFGFILFPTMVHPSPLPPPHTSFVRKLSSDRSDDGDGDLGLANNAPIIQSVPSLWGIPLKYISYVSFQQPEFDLTHTYMQVGDAGRPELSVGTYNALLSRFGFLVTNIFSSDCCPYE